jgi:hypothetical protein
LSVDTADIVDNAVTDAKISLDSVYTMWREGHQHMVVFKRQTISFDPSIILYPGHYPLEPSVEVGVAAAENNVYAVWPQNPESLIYKRSTDGGASFNLGWEINVDWRGLPTSPAIVATGNNVDLVWQNGNFQGDESIIIYKRSTDGGVGFNIPLNLSFGFKHSRFPDVAASGNNVYVIWHEAFPGGDSEYTSEILYRRSTDGGASFEFTISNLSNNPGHSLVPAIAAMGNNVYVVWTDTTSGNSEILYRRSTDGGASFGNTMNLSNNPGQSLAPAIAAMGNNVYVVWTDDTPGRWNIMYRRSTNGGVSFGGTVILTVNDLQLISFYPAIAASNNLT